MKGRPKKTAFFLGHYDSSNVLLITIFDIISWVTHHSHEVGHQLRTGWKKEKKCQHSYTYLESWQKAMVQLPFLASCHSVQFSATFRSWIISWVHKWCACQPVTAWILGVLNTATLSSEYSNIKYVRKFKGFLKTDQSKSFENSFEQQFNEIWIKLLNWANYSSGLFNKQTPQSKFPWRKCQGNSNQVWHFLPSLYWKFSKVKIHITGDCY